MVDTCGLQMSGFCLVVELAQGGSFPTGLPRLGKTSEKKRLYFGHCPKVALTPSPSILNIRELTFVLAHFGQA